MKHLIWYSSNLQKYNHGTEIDLRVNESLSGEKMDVLYEMDESEIRLVRKIVDQLNAARKEKAFAYQMI